MTKSAPKSGVVSRPSRSAIRVSRDEAAKNLQRMRERDAEMVTGIFKNLENPAVNGSRGALNFTFKLYGGDEFVHYELLDGERYTIPRGVARHLNNNCWYIEHQHQPGQSGATGVRHGVPTDGIHRSPEPYHFKKVHRFAFHALDYMDDGFDELPALSSGR